MEQYLNAALKKDLTIQLKELALDSAKFTKNYVGEQIRVWIPIHRNIITIPQSVI